MIEQCKKNIKRANQLYANKNYKEALEIYYQLSDSGLPIYSSIKINIDSCLKKINMKGLELLNDDLIQIGGKLSSYSTQESKTSYYAGLMPKSGKLCDLKSSFETMYESHPIYFPPIIDPLVTIIIPVYKGLKDLENCLRSLSQHINSEPSFEIIALDDCPSERALWAIPQSGGLLKINNEHNLGFLHNCNKGATFARGRYLCFLNSDTIVSAGWLKSMVDCLSHTSNVGIVGGMLINNDGTIQDAGWRILRNGWGHPIGNGESPNDGRFTYRREVDCVTGANLLISKSLFDSLGGFDKLYAPAFYEEFDLSFRARRLGFKTFYEPRSRVVHIGSASYGSDRRNELSSRNHKEFSKRFADLLELQPSTVDNLFQLLEIGTSIATILIIDFDVPQPDRHAGDITMFRYISLMVGMGFRVILCPFNGALDGPHASNLERMGVMVIKEFQNFDSFIEDNGMLLDKVMLARPNVADKLIDKIRSYSKAKIYYYTHDLHYLRLEKEALLTNDSKTLSESKIIKEKEFAIFNSVDVVISPSAHEADIIKSNECVSCVEVMPPYFFESSELKRKKNNHFDKLSDILFVGGFPHKPNVDAAFFIVNEIMPIIWKRFPYVRLILAGYAPPVEIRSLSNENIFVTGQVPDLQPYYESARLILCPLRYGAGVKGKVIEAMRFGVPVVTTSIGAEGIDVVHKENILIAECAEEIADCAINLLDNSSLCEQISFAAFNLISDKYSIARAKNTLRSIFKIA